MRLTRLVRGQLVVFTIITVIAGAVILFGYIKVPAMMGIGRYVVTVQLPHAAGLYTGGNVTYRGTEVGRVKRVHLTNNGVVAELSLRSDIAIPADTDAQVHSASSIGEQYVALSPRTGNGPTLHDGYVIPLNRVTVPPDINELVNAANRGLKAIPRDDVRTVIDESYAAVGGLGPELSRIVAGSTKLAIDADKNLGTLTDVIDRIKPVLDSQASTSDEIQSWAAHIATVTRQVRDNDSSFAGLLQNGPAAVDEARQLVERLRPTLPVLLANLVSVGQVAVAYQPAIEQLLVLLPEGVAAMQAHALANKDSKHPGGYLDFNLNLNLPPPCTTGYLPAQQQRTANFEDSPERPAADLYCRIPQDAPNDVRGARNYPCLTRPGKRAPTVKMCESDEQYVPLNDGNNWKGDPNATLSGQDIPQLAPPTPPVQILPPIGIANYDPATGTYVGPDGHVYTQGDLAQSPGGRTWQSMLTPPTR
ncbi:MCE family protein [Mycobacterium vicinigordonae]|uniref:MCE family protein n=1 Tax=Mycobacterium vicinigordonae TaxID=1719132 RepID=A0A7D6I7E7_9MYCO|nr:MlaD family protein [Mycobacterium vicinigordonae]QLL07556.1 MCE family protein [Mycobacterium vicinigordonae]